MNRKCYGVLIVVTICSLLFINCFSVPEHKEPLVDVLEKFDRIAEAELRSYFPQDENAEYIIIERSQYKNYPNRKAMTEINVDDTYIFQDITLYRNVPFSENVFTIYRPYIEITFQNKKGEIYKINEEIKGDLLDHYPEQRVRHNSIFEGNNLYLPIESCLFYLITIL
jgi:hypothetical protein